MLTYEPFCRTCDFPVLTVPQFREMAVVAAEKHVENAKGHVVEIREVVR